MAMNIEQARLNMVENQVRPWEVLDGRVLDVISRVRREDFVAAEHRQLAFADLCLPLGHGEVMMKPVVEGRVLQALELLPTDHVLEIGTGSGFLTACLATLSARVSSVDIHADFIAAAARRLQAAGITNAALATGEAVNGWQPDGLFDALVVTGAVHAIPPRWLTWLKPGARADRPRPVAGAAGHPAHPRRRRPLSRGNPVRNRSALPDPCRTAATVRVLISPPNRSPRGTPCV